MTKPVQVTRFSFTGGRAKPIKQALELTGVNQYDERQIVFAVWPEGKEKSSHVMSLSLDDVQEFATMFKNAVSQAKLAPDTTPVEARKKLDAKKAKEQTTQPTQDVNAVLEALKAAGYSITPPQPVKEAENALPAPEKPKARRTSTHTKPEPAPKAVPALDDLDDISTTDLEAVSSILSILLGKRGTK